MGLLEVRLLMCGGTILDPSVGEFLMEHNLPLVDAYGMSETTGAISVGSWRPGSVGKAWPGTKLKLDNVDETGEGEVRGEFQVHLSGR